MTDIVLKPDIGRRDSVAWDHGWRERSGRCMALYDQMEPSASALSAGAPIAVDLSSMELGQQIEIL